MSQSGRILHHDWDLYDTRHTVYRPARLGVDALEAGYWRADARFYEWPNILRGARSKPTLRGRLRHVAYAAGWKKLEPLWDMVIRARRASSMLPALEAVLGRDIAVANPRTVRPALANLGIP